MKNSDETPPFVVRDDQGVHLFGTAAERDAYVMGRVLVKKQDDEPIGISVKEASEAVGGQVCKRMWYMLMDRGEIRSFRIGNRRIMFRDSWRQFIESGGSAAPEGK